MSSADGTARKATTYSTKDDFHALKETLAQLVSAHHRPPRDPAGKPVLCA